ncbi:MAG: (Fe-S)-binding protein [Bacteroidota bacterium]
MLQSIIFMLVAGLGLGYALWQFAQVRQAILLGKDEAIDGPSGNRWRNMTLVALGQKKMFKRLIPAILHLMLYVAFVITQIELIEIFIDGIFGVHRFFADKLGGFYTFMISFIEVLSVLAFVATLIFLIRRNALKIPRFIKPEMKGWPKLDANLILIFEIILLICIFTMNGTDVVLQSLDPAHYPATGTLAVSSWLGPALFGGFSESTLVVLERVGWWGHIIMVLWFLNYLPKSKHLHIILAFPNTFYARLNPRGQMVNMPTIMNEVKSMMNPAAAVDAGGEMEELPTFGAHDIQEMSWIDLLGAYSCTECGRCTAECPANLTGKKLSPRKIVMDVRDRTQEVHDKLRSGKEEYCANPSEPLSISNFDDGKSLWDYISREEIHACTTCNACVEACPVLINPLEMINKMRRYEILTESAGPGDWLPLFNSIENSGAAWSVGTSRLAWAQENEA